jgi:hypothetical protein
MLDGTRPAEEREHGPGRVCVCGHAASAHMGEGTCLAVYAKSKDTKGTVKAGSICPCLRLELQR